MPTIVFDGNCSFCRMWIDFWRTLTGDSVDYIPYQTAAEQFPGIPPEHFRKAIHFITPDGRFSGAEAVCRLLARVSGYQWMLRLYLLLPGFAPLAELIYRIVAAHRNAAYRITRALWGARVERPTYHLASAVFARALAFIYLIAFASFGMQVRGLIGSEGILPIGDYLRVARAQLGTSALWKIPGIFWWGHNDFTLLSITWGGVALSAVAIIARPHSRWQRAVFAILFVYYLSIVSAGQTFMSFQWDLLLLETGFLAIFLRPSLPRVWLFQWLLFRLMFESGAVKLLSHDPSWHNLTALAVHYETQPLPTPLAWYAIQLPLWFHKFSAVMVFVVEVGLPWLTFGPRRLRQIAALGFLALQLLIFFTGNYTFFNVLTIALCLFLLDDSFFSPRSAPVPPASSNRFVSAALLIFILSISCIQLAGTFSSVPAAFNKLVAAESSFGLVNEYGLFASMTTKRPEIEIEGSMDGEHWLPYVFRYKIGPLDRAPRWVAPFQPRVDWQMWFAALGSYRDNPWFIRFLVRLLEGSKPVLALIEHDPFGGTPPKHIRAMVYEYRFTNFEERRKAGNWWKREFKGAYFPPVSLR